MEFKKGSKYSRNEVCKLYFGKPCPHLKGGNWMTGYWQIDNMLNPQLEAEGYTPPVSKTNELVVWMNIGVPGRTGHDFENRYDKDIKVITWFGKPGTHSKQPIFAKLKDGKLKGHFLLGGIKMTLMTLVILGLEKFLMLKMVT